MKDNVVPFPQMALSPGLPKTEQEAELRLDLMQQIFLQDVASQIMQTVVQQMMVAGFDILEDEYNTTFGFLMESVKASLAKTQDLYHPFHSIADNVMLEHECGAMIVADKIPEINFYNEKQSAEEAESTES